MLIAFNLTANFSGLDFDSDRPASPFSLAQKIVIAIIASVLSVLTVVGNSMVMISFKIDKQLQTISNYFLFSLAVADFAVGLISMPLFTMFTIYGYWPLGPHICDTWLALDYLASNASVLNLLIISFDRYFSVTRPLTYRAKRTTRRAMVMIGCAWGFSLLLWPPWIYAWPYIDGERKVPPHECYIQFIETNQFITFGTAIAAFYVPVTVMCILYYKIWRETKKRQKDLPNLQGGKKHDSSKRSNSSDETREVDGRARSESGDADSVYHVRGALHDTRWRENQALSQRPKRGWPAVRDWCVAWWHSGREDLEDTEPEEEPSDPGYATPVSVETPLQSTVSRCTSLNVIRDPYAGRGGSGGSSVVDGGTSPLRRTYDNPAPIPAARDSRSLPPNTRINATTSPAPKSASADSVYTILIRLPEADTERPSIKMITEESPPNNARTHFRPARGDSEMNLHPAGHAALTRRTSHIQDVRIPLNAKIIPKQLAGKGITSKQPKKKKTQEKKQESKAAKTLSAILLSFIITWTPYNILVLLKPLTACTQCDELWSFFYALCYINSTINPVCYALCNATFRRTYVRILTCKWHNRNREAMTRGVYNYDETREVDGRARSESGDADSVYHVRGALHDTRWRENQALSQRPKRGWPAVRDWCVAWWHSGREDLEDTEPEEEPSDPGYATPVSVETPLQSTVSRCTSLNVIRDPYAGRGGSGGSSVVDGGTSPLRRTYDNPAPIPAARDSRSLPPNTRINATTSPAPKSASADSVYTILIRLPEADTERPSIKMITEESPPNNARTHFRPARGDSEMNLHPAGHAALTRRTSHIQDVRIPLNAKIIPKQLAGKGITSKQPKKKKTQEKKQESKAAKTLSAILLSFIITWTPYNILVLLKPLTACTQCDELWSFFYALCYINSTINPVCYALCNATFRRTYVRILTCKWHNRNREAMTRGVYN